jgi:hypothetical protein
MDLSDFDASVCPIDFVCAAEEAAWAGWIFAAWIVAMIALGIVGIVYGRTRNL